MGGNNGVTGGSQVQHRSPELWFYKAIITYRTRGSVSFVICTMIARDILCDQGSGQGFNGCAMQCVLVHQHEKHHRLLLADL